MGPCHPATAISDGWQTRTSPVPVRPDVLDVNRLPRTLRTEAHPEDDMKIYRDKNDWWIGYYRGIGHHYVCPLPTLVIRWRRRGH